jgi:hypothetical protein
MNLNFVGCSTGRSADFSPLRIARKAANLETLYERYDYALVILRQRSSGIKSDPTRMISASSIPNTMPADPP